MFTAEFSVLMYNTYAEYSRSMYLPTIMRHREAYVSVYKKKRCNFQERKTKRKREREGRENARFVGHVIITSTVTIKIHADTYESLENNTFSFLVV